MLFYLISIFLFLSDLQKHNILYFHNAIFFYMTNLAFHQLLGQSFYIFLSSKLEKQTLKILHSHFILFLLFSLFYVLYSLLTFQPIFWDVYNTNIHRSIISRKHCRLNLDFSSVSVKSRVNMICGRFFMACSQHYHFVCFSVD